MKRIDRSDVFACPVKRKDRATAKIPVIPSSILSLSSARDHPEFLKELHRSFSAIRSRALTLFRQLRKDPPLLSVLRIIKGNPCQAKKRNLTRLGEP